MTPAMVYGIAIGGAVTPLVYLWFIKWLDRRNRRRREEQTRAMIGESKAWWGQK